MPIKNIQTYFSNSKKLLEENKYDEALASIDKALEIERGNPKYITLKATILWRMKAFDLALNTIEQAILLDGNSAESWYRKGTIQCDLGNTDQAVKCYEKTLSIDGSYAHAFNGLGNILFHKGNLEQALKLYEEALKLDKKEAIFLCSITNIYFKLKDYDKALLHIKKAEELNENLFPVQYLKGNLLEKQGKFNLSIECHKKATKLDETSPHPWNSMGNIYRNIRKHEKAIECYNKALDFDPEHFYSMNGLGNVYYDLKEFTKAMNYYEKAIRLNPNSPDYWNGKANTLAAQGNEIKAIKSYDTAIEIDNNYAPAWNGKGAIFIKNKNYQFANICFTRANFLDNNYVSNSLKLYTEYPQAPFYTIELIQHYIHPKAFYRWRDLSQLTLIQCKNVLGFINYIKISRKNSTIRNWEWSKWLGLTYFYMGHPIKSFDFFQETLSENQNDLLVHFYLVLSGDSFAEPVDEYLEKGIEIAKKLLPQKNKSSLFKAKKQFSPYDLQQLYYAGQLFYMNQNFEESYHYFDLIKIDYLPAAYMLLQMKELLTEEKTKQIVEIIARKERNYTEPFQKFTKGISVQRLDFHQINFRKPFLHYAHYTEIKDGIDIFSQKVQSYQINSLNITPTRELKTFWYTWSLSKEQFREIFELIQKEEYRQITSTVTRNRENILLLSGAIVDLDNILIEEKINNTDSEKIRDTYEKLKTEISPKAREIRFGNMINDWILTDLSHYHLLTGLFVLTNELEESQKIHLDFYSVLQDYSRKKPSDILLAGFKGSSKGIINHSINLFGQSLDLGGNLLISIFKELAKDAFVELSIKYLKRPNPKFKTYSKFKNGLNEFIGEEQKRLGDDFENQYPLFGFDDWFV